MAVVLDASVALSWLIPDERNAESERLLESSYLQRIFVPSIWSYEIANGLLFAQKANRIDDKNIGAAYDLLRAVGIESMNVKDDVFQLIPSLKEAAVKYDLTVYDSAYLSLAVEYHLPLATFDKKLIAAAEKFEVSVL